MWHTVSTLRYQISFHRLGERFQRWQPNIATTLQRATSRNSTFRVILESAVVWFASVPVEWNVEMVYFRLVFGPEHIMFVEGFPRREYGAIHIKFYVVFPHNTEAASKQRRPLLPRAVLSGTSSH